MKGIARLAQWIRGLIERRDEFQEPSGGFLPFRVRQGAVALLGDGGLLDIGAGEGLLLKAMGVKAPKRIYCLDLDHDRLKQARRRWSREGVYFLVGDGCYLPFKTGSLDQVTLLNTLLNITPKKLIASILGEALRVCKDNGKVIFDYRNRANPFIVLLYRTVALHDPEIQHPLRPFSRKEMMGMLRSLGVKGEVIHHPIPRWWRFNPPAYLVELRKGKGT